MEVKEVVLLNDKCRRVSQASKKNTSDMLCGHIFIYYCYDLKVAFWNYKKYESKLLKQCYQLPQMI